MKIYFHGVNVFYWQFIHAVRLSFRRQQQGDDPTMKQQSKLYRLIGEYKAKGGLVHYYPRKRVVSINGFPAINEKQAVEKLSRYLQAMERGEA